MRVLLDTHAVLWWSVDDGRLSETARSVIRDGRNEIVVSAASVWEIAIKSAKGRLELPSPVEQYVDDRLRRNRWSTLAIDVRHVIEAASLPEHHRDPFDRALVAQGRVEGLPILTTDAAITRYDVETIW